MGRDKAWIEWPAQRTNLPEPPPSTLLARTVSVLFEVARPVIVIASTDGPLPPLDPKVELLRDDAPFEGPLVALAKGLEALDGRAELVFVCATDHPHLVSAVPARLFELARGHDAAIPIKDGEQLLCAVYAVRTLTVCRRLVERGERSMRAFAAEIDVRRVRPEELLADTAVMSADPDLLSFDDIDTALDLERHLALPRNER